MYVCMYVCMYVSPPGKQAQALLSTGSALTVRASLALSQCWKLIGGACLLPRIEVVVRAAAQAVQWQKELVRAAAATASTHSSATSISGTSGRGGVGSISIGVPQPVTVLLTALRTDLEEVIVTLQQVYIGATNSSSVSSAGNSSSSSSSRMGSYRKLAEKVEVVGGTSTYSSALLKQAMESRREFCKEGQ
jgi:hypothetical protein